MTRKHSLNLLLILIASCGVTASATTYPFRATNFDDIRAWIATNITYVAETPADYHWQSPETTLRLRTGMCADYAILLMSWAHDQLGISGYLLLLRLSDTTGHAVCQFNAYPAMWFSPQSIDVYRATGYTIFYILTLDEALTYIASEANN